MIGSDTRVLVAGGRVTGVAAARALRDRGARVTVTDADPGQLAKVELTGVDLVPGLEIPPPGTDLVVTSPGFRPDSPVLRAAADAGIDVIGDVELAWRFDQERARPARWLVITGTNGKTTTVGMLESMLGAGRVDAVACGNVGPPVVDAVREGHEVLAVELSSFQLHWSRSLRPHAAVVLNVAPDHLDWHGSMAEYTRAKAKAYAAGTLAVVNEDEPAAAMLAAGLQQVGFTVGAARPGAYGVTEGVLVDPSGRPIVQVDEIRPPGPHNVSNALAAAALAGTVGVGPGDAAAGLRSFAPAGHRSALVADVAGVRFIDDSKATNPHATRAALLAHPRVVWIAGGLLKGADVDDLVAATASHLVGAVLIGTDRHQIAAALARHAPDLPVHVVESGNHEAMVEVVAAASAMARPGDVVLLAPAAASLDMFTDYQHRGRAFADAVHALQQAEPS